MLTILNKYVVEALLGVVLLAAIIMCSYFYGKAVVQNEWNAEKIALQHEQELLASKSNATNDKAQMIVQERVVTVKEKGETIVKQVEKLVPVDCGITGDYRVLYNSSVQNANSSASVAQ